MSKELLTEKPFEPEALLGAAATGSTIEVAQLELIVHGGQSPVVKAAEFNSFVGTTSEFNSVVGAGPEFNSVVGAQQFQSLIGTENGFESIIG